MPMIVKDGLVVTPTAHEVRAERATLEAAEIGARIAARAQPGLARAAEIMPYVGETYRALLRDFERGV